MNQRIVPDCHFPLCRPFVKLFRTDDNYYVYDVNTNRILRVDVILWELLAAIIDDRGLDYFLSRVEAVLPLAPNLLISVAGSSPQQVVKSYLRFLDEARTVKGYFSCNRPRNMTAYDSTFVRGKQRHQIQQLTLEVTQSCNLRCRYCAYSGAYSYSRTHSAKHMDIRTARRAIDFFLNRTTKASHHCLGFYGGEPFLRLSFIRECIDYARRRANGLDLLFTVTTNGTLLSDEVISTLIECDMSLLVSLDGPAKCHDKNRISREDQGTWNTVVANLKRLKRSDPSYYRRKVGFSGIVAPNVNPHDVYLFYRTNKDVVGAASSNIRMGLVSDYGTCYYLDNPLTADWLKQWHALRYRYYQMVLGRDGEPRDRFIESHFGRNFTDIYKRKYYRNLPRAIGRSGCCTPGVRKLFLDCDGKYHMCERINETVSIGSVESGFDQQLIERLYDEYRRMNEERCTSCWAVRFCSLCWAQIVSCGVLDKDNMDSACRGVQVERYCDLVDYCRIVETNPGAFNYMEDILVE